LSRASANPVAALRGVEILLASKAPTALSHQPQVVQRFGLRGLSRSRIIEILSAAFSSCDATGQCQFRNLQGNLRGARCKRQFGFGAVEFALPQPKAARL